MTKVFNYILLFSLVLNKFRAVKTILKDATIVNEGTIIQGDVLINKDRIERVGGNIRRKEAKEKDCSGLHLFPGVIDDQVHFREPGLTHKANIATESAAAVAGGTTSFMEMPNTKPTATTQEELQKKYDIAAKTSHANFSFFMGASNENVEEVLKTDPTNVCGVKIFMGSSTGNMLVDNRKTLNNLFSKVDMLIATHCEDEATIRKNMEKAKKKYGEANLTAEMHPIIRNTKGCYKSSAVAVELAKKHGTRLHILHISTAEEVALFTNRKKLKNKKITAEVCVHHLSFNSDEYATLGNKIKCNPAIKTPQDQAALWKALLSNRFDIIATDHAPHTKAEKARPYTKAPSGLPLVQHSLNLMLNHYRDGRISLERIVEKMCHAPAICFKLKERGYLREGYFADMVLVDLHKKFKVEKKNILYKCGWSPLEGRTMHSKIVSTIINGKMAYNNGKVMKRRVGERLLFGH